MVGFISMFLNPWALAIGLLAIAVPIIIHLINRMQFRRVRWAAMEFLLAAQKRMRQRLLIETWKKANYRAAFAFGWHLIPITPFSIK